MKTHAINVFHPQKINPHCAQEHKARIFHFTNPHVFNLAEQLMSQALEKMETCGIKLVWERMRWHYLIETTDRSYNPDTGEPFKLNNNWHSYYARWLLQKHPEWEGRIRLRALKAA